MQGAPSEGQEEFQRLASEIREAQQNVESLQKQSDLLSDSIEEVENTLETVEGMDDVEPGTEVLVPIGSDTYLPAELKTTDRFLSNLGADLVAERGPKEVEKLLEKQEKDFQESLERIQDRIEELNEEIEELRGKGQELVSQSQQAEE